MGLTTSRGAGAEAQSFVGDAAGHIVQLCYNLSGPAMEDLLYKAESLQSGVGAAFSGLRLSEPIPDESILLRFRHLLEGHQLGRGLFEEIKGHLEEQ